jgi:ribonuclease/clavin/mitogillin
MKTRATKRNSAWSTTINPLFPTTGENIQSKDKMNIANVGYDSTNYYLLETVEAKLLVDSGWPGTLPKLAAALKRKGIALDEIKHLLVTHFHPDHAGLTQELKNRGAQLILLEGQTDNIAPLEELYKAKKLVYAPIQKEGNIQLCFSDSRRFLSTLGIEGEIIPTPGHSPDSITLILDDGFAFTGDLHSPEMVPEEQLAATQTSWDRIRQHKIKRIFPGHGNQVFEAK